MTAKPFSAEVLLLGWGTSPASGHWIKVQLDPALDGEAHPFRLFKSGAANGQRFRMDFAAIGDDEMVAAGTAGSSADLSRTPAAGAAIREDAGATPSLDPPAAGPHPLVKRAGVLAKDPAFQRWGRCATEEAAAGFIRTCCQIASRRDLATDACAAKAFEALEAEYRASQYSPHLTGRK